MYKVVKQHEGTIRPVADNKTANNLITREISPAVSLAVINATDYHDTVTADYNWIYYVVEGMMILQFGNDTYALQPGDSCYVAKGEKYNMMGTFKTVVVSQPAFGTPTDIQPDPAHSDAPTVQPE